MQYSLLLYAPSGVLRADDALLAAAHGAAAVWVSNHGGRQLDSKLLLTSSRFNRELCILAK